MDSIVSIPVFAGAYAAAYELAGQQRDRELRERAHQPNRSSLEAGFGGQSSPMFGRGFGAAGPHHPPPPPSAYIVRPLSTGPTASNNSGCFELPFRYSAPMPASRSEEPGVVLLFVSLGSMQLAPNLAGSRFQLRIRYGGNGRFRDKVSHKVRSTPSLGGATLRAEAQQGALVQLHDLETSRELNGATGVCESWDEESRTWHVRFLLTREVTAVKPDNVSLAAQVFANPDAMFVFPWTSDLPPHLTFALRKLGLYDTTISETTVRVPFDESHLGCTRQELLFLGKRGLNGFVGQLNSVIGLRRLSRRDLLLGSPGSSAGLQEILASLAHMSMPVGHLGPNSFAGTSLGAPSNSSPPALGMPIEGTGAGTAPAAGGTAAADGAGPVVTPTGALVEPAGATPLVTGRPVPNHGSWGRAYLSGLLLQ